MKKIKSMNEQFNNDDHHDSHEFLIWLLNQINDEIAADNKEKDKALGIPSQNNSNQVPRRVPSNNSQVLDGNNQKLPSINFLSELFEGKLVSKTTCIRCESGNEREESFMALSIDIEKNTSIN